MSVTGGFMPLVDHSTEAIAIHELEVQVADFANVRWTKNVAANVDLVTKKKQEELTRLLAQSETVRATWPESEGEVAALCLEGRAWLAYAEMSAALPPPRGLTDAELQAYHAELEVAFAAPAREKARTSLEGAKREAGDRPSAWGDSAKAMSSGLHTR